MAELGNARNQGISSQSVDLALDYSNLCIIEVKLLLLYSNDAEMNLINHACTIEIS